MQELDKSKDQTSDDLIEKTKLKQTKTKKAGKSTAKKNKRDLDKAKTAQTSGKVASKSKSASKAKSATKAKSFSHQKVTMNPSDEARQAKKLRKQLRERLDVLQKASIQAPVHFSRNNNYLNRELSWLQFNLRVLQEARDAKNPLMERLSFLSITASNLDEFFMVRAASLKDMFNAEYDKPDLAGLLPEEQLSSISEQTHALVSLMYSTWTRGLMPALERQHVHVLKPEELTEAQQKEIEIYFTQVIYPILTPMAVDSGRPFPLINNRSLNICALLQPGEDQEGDEDEEELKFVTMQVPGVIPRLYRFQTRVNPSDGESSPTSHVPHTGDATPDSDPNEEGGARAAIYFILLEDIIRCFLPLLFSGRSILAQAVYRIMRNADLDIDEEEAADLLIEIEKQLRLRRWGEVIRLEAEDGIDNRLLERLIPNLKVEENDVYLIGGPLDLTFLNKLRGDSLVKQRSHWYYSAYTPQTPHLLLSRKREAEAESLTDTNMFSLIQKGSMLMYHPYDSFQPVLDFIKQAAHDPDVLAIKQTLYRISGDSPLIAYLEEAAKNGKQVLVLVELKARFDEENNIQWARRLEKAGCHVIYGLLGLKTHSKITLVVRREEDGIRRYLHLGTGNYNDQTAKLYTDLGYFVSTAELGEDATEFFNMLSGFAEPESWNSLVVAPLWLRGTFEDLIRREKQHAMEGLGGHVMVKMNSLVDTEMIDLLYDASQAGVKIDLIVRGICCLRPAVPGLSENIEVHSLVGRYLEHARIYRFANAGQTEYYLSSADWMTRNLDRRVELLFPIEEEDCRAVVQEILDLQWEDNVRAHIMQGDGTYRKPDRRGKVALDSQIRQCELAVERNPKPVDVLETRVFEPVMAPWFDVADTVASDAGG